jgi:hypothetical protein
VTEREWLESTDPLRMLRHVGARANDRKTLLLTCACLGRIWALLPGLGRRWVRLAAQVADGRAAHHRLSDKEGEDALLVAHERAPPPWRGAVLAAQDIFSVAWNLIVDEGDAVWAAERAAQAGLVREVFGNPFRPPTVDPAWLARNGGAVPRLAQSIHDERRFAEMPILADALEEAGCTDEEMLGHCRGPGPHVPGCWLLDLLVGRASPDTPVGD